MSIRLGHREASYIGGVDDVLAAFHLTKLEDSLLRHRGPLIQAACDDHRMGFQKSPAHPCQLTIQPVLSLQHLLQIEMRSRVTETGPSDCRHVVAILSIIRPRDCQKFEGRSRHQTIPALFPTRTYPSPPVPSRTSKTSLRNSHDDRSTLMRHPSQLLETLDVWFVTL
jgi:hypothetical protein